MLIRLIEQVLILFDLSGKSGFEYACSTLNVHPVKCDDYKAPNHNGSAYPNQINKRKFIHFQGYKFNFRFTLFLNPNIIPS
jgi:hypothetical protein